MPAGDRPDAPDSRAFPAHSPSAGRRHGVPPGHTAWHRVRPAGAACGGAFARASAATGTGDLEGAGAEGFPAAARPPARGTMDVIRPEWPVAANVHAFFTTRPFGDLSQPDARGKLRALLPGEPLWLQQVHGTMVARVEDTKRPVQADASMTRQPYAVCAVMAADCMPVLLADRRGAVVAA